LGKSLTTIRRFMSNRAPTGKVATEPAGFLCSY
jgi:hypothetical protein